MGKLTVKQKRFVREYKTNGGNGTQAAIKAGYSEKTAYSIAEENLRKPEIIDALEEEEKIQREKHDYKFSDYVNDILLGMSMAKDHSNDSAYFKGVELLGKAYGYNVDRVKNDVSFTQALVVFDESGEDDDTEPSSSTYS
jgi:phage terminase small subunit